MCGFTALGAVTSVVGLGANLVGKRSEAKANEAAAKVDAKTAAENVKFVDLKIRDALLRGDTAAKQVRDEGFQFRGQQRAAMAASGVDVTFGSPLDVIYETTLGVYDDIMQTEKNTAEEVLDLEQERMNFERQADASKGAAKGYRRGGTLSVLGTLATGAGQIATDYYRARID